MASQAQLNANRANAQQSTGPKSPEGKAICRHNATRHGLTGKQIVVKGENPEDYDAFRESLYSQHAPATEHEATLIEEIAGNWWRLQRARRHEALIIQNFGLEACLSDPQAMRIFQNIQRYANTLHRAWTRANTELACVQKARRANMADPPPAPKHAKRQPRTRLEAEIGSVLSPELAEMVEVYERDCKSEGINPWPDENPDEE